MRRDSNPDAVFDRYLRRPSPRRLERVVRHFEDHVWRVALAIAGNPDDAADLSQDVFLGLLARPPKPGSVRSPKGWLAARIATAARDRRRSAERRVRREKLAAERAVSEEGLSADDVDAVRRAVDALPDRLRIVVELRYLASLRNRDVALALDRSEASIEKDLRLARDLLRERLGQLSGALALLVASIAGARAAPPSAVIARWLTVIHGARPVALAFSHSWHIVSEIVVVKKIAALALGAVILIVTSFILWNRGKSPARELEETTVAADSSGETVEAPSTVAFRPPRDPTQNVEEETLESASTAEMAPGDSDRGSLRVRLFWDADRTPGAHLGVILEPIACENSFLCGREAETDADGEFLFEDLVPGEYRVELRAGTRPARRSTSRATVIAREEALVAVRLADYLEVSGVVLDESRRPVEGAEVLVSRDTLDNVAAAVAARTAADGTFHLRGVGGSRYISARAPGHGASSQHYLTGGRGNSEEIELILEGVGGALRGRVIDRDGAPVEGAVVLVGSREPAHGSHVAPPPPFAARTDASGTFTAYGLRPGDHPVAARALLLAPTETLVRIEAGRTAAADIVLGDAALLTGTVRGPDGSPLAEARIRVEKVGDAPRARSSDLLASDVLRSNAITGSNGQYALDGLAPGEHAVFVDAGDRGHATSTLIFEAGHETEKDFEIAPGATLAGRVLTEEGRPIARALVGLRAAGERSWPTLITDDEGRFERRDLARVEHWVSVTEPGARVPSLELDGLLPRQEEYEITIPDEARANAALHGRIVDARGRAVRGARVTCQRQDRPASASAETGFLGGFELGSLPRGEYLVRVDAKGQPRTWIGSFTLAPGEKADIGTTRIPAPGFVNVTIARTDGGPMEDLIYSIIDEEGRYAAVVRLSSESSHREALAPGKYRLVVREGENDEPTKDVGVEIAAGEEKRVEVTIGSKSP